jgi:hypothetical protein
MNLIILIRNSFISHNLENSYIGLLIICEFEKENDKSLWLEEPD